MSSGDLRHIVLELRVTTMILLSVDRCQIIVVEGEDKNKGHLILSYAVVILLHPLS